MGKICNVCECVFTAVIWLLYIFFFSLNFFVVVVVGYFNLSALFVYQSVSFIIYLCSPLSYAHQLNCIFDGPIWLAHRSTLVISHFSLLLPQHAYLSACPPARWLCFEFQFQVDRCIWHANTHTYPKYVCGACILNVCPKTSSKPIDSFTFRRRHRRCSFYMCFCVQCNASIFGAGFDWKLQRLFFLALSAFNFGYTHTHYYYYYFIMYTLFLSVWDMHSSMLLVFHFFVLFSGKFISDGSYRIAHRTLSKSQTIQLLQDTYTHMDGVCSARACARALFLPIGMDWFG